MAKWLDGKGSEEDIVISSRIRLARNLENVNYPEMMDNEDSQKVIKKVNDSIIEGNTSLAKDFQLYRVNKMSQLDRKLTVENRLVSPDLIKKPEKSAFLLSRDEKVSIMINEEDHIRIQVLFSGLDLNNAWDLADKIDDILEENMRYAFDEKLGYLTSCPTNVGTGLRASVMVHLPCLVLTGYINKVIQAVNQVGLTVRGLYGEGTDALGNLFQISNQTTLGETEEEIIQKLKNIVQQIIGKERVARDNLLTKRGIELEDKVYRSLGILQNARIITSKEAMNLMSDVRMGIEMGIINNIKYNTINNLIIKTQPANIQKQSDKELTYQERDIKRSEIIREKLKS